MRWYSSEEVNSLKWVLDKSKAIAPQICEQVCTRIALGELKAQERLPSVRELAIAAGVNPNTVQKAFDMLEQEGILYSQRGSGWFVSEATERAGASLERVRQDKTHEYFLNMRSLGFSDLQIKDFVSKWNS